MFKRINCSLITALAVAISADPHICNPLFTRSLDKNFVLISLQPAVYGPNRPGANEPRSKQARGRTSQGANEPGGERTKGRTSQGRTGKKVKRQIPAAVLNKNPTIKLIQPT